MALTSEQSWAVINVAASGLPIEIPITLETPVHLEATKEAVGFWYDFNRPRTRHVRTVWLSQPRGGRRTRGPACCS
jgi:hypothetical protein